MCYISMQFYVLYRHNQWRNNTFFLQKYIHLSILSWKESKLLWCDRDRDMGGKVRLPYWPITSLDHTMLCYLQGPQSISSASGSEGILNQRSLLAASWNWFKTHCILREHLHLSHLTASVRLHRCILILCREISDWQLGQGSICNIYIYIYIYIYMYHHHHHHIVPLAQISLTLSRHFSLSFIAFGRSSGLHPISSHSCCMYAQADHPAFAWPYAGVHRRTSLMSSSLLLQQCSVCLVRLTCIVFVMRGRWSYSWCFVGSCHQDLFNTALNILV